MSNKYYVTMTDKAMSGWGYAKNKKNKLVFECSSYDEAIIVMNNAKKRSEMKYINITSSKPVYSLRQYYVSYKTKDVYPMWYEK
jgi:hypothetical protein